MFETVESILRVTTFIAVGGLVAIMFFFVFAQSIMGSKTVHKQLKKLIGQNEQIISMLGRILKKSPNNSDDNDNSQ